MMSFKSEHANLILWLQSQLEDTKKLSAVGEGLGYPNERAIQEKKVFNEYYEKAAALKLKYAIGPQAEKSQAFNDILKPIEM